jgi:hypothetical protein
MTPTETVRIRLVNDGRWAVMSISLQSPFTGGKLLTYPADFVHKIQGLDELASRYELKNWESGLISGALHAYRRSKNERQKILLSELEGQLKSSDMTALAFATTIGVSRLLGEDASDLILAGWRFEIEDNDHEESRNGNAYGRKSGTLKPMV